MSNKPYKTSGETPASVNEPAIAYRKTTVQTPSSDKPYKTSDETPASVNEPVAAYEKTTRTSSSDRWNPNVPFHGTQEEWWEHFHKIEQGTFYPVEEVHQEISQWLDSQKK